MPPDDELLAKHERCARVLLVDAESRVLLVSSWLEDRECAIWLAPGGALQPPETFEEAARRECFEETGLELPGELEHVWNRQIAWSWGGRRVETLEKYFFARVERFEPEPAELEDYEDELLLGFRWWSADGLRDCDQLVAPADFPELLPPLARGELPEAPLQVGE